MEYLKLARIIGGSNLRWQGGCIVKGIFTRDAQMTGEIEPRPV